MGNAVVSLALAASVASSELGAAPAARERRAALRFGVIAEEPNEPGRMLKTYGELLVRLREGLAPAGVDVPALVVARDLDDLAQRLVRGEVDFVIETAFPTLVLRERSQRLEPALVVERRGKREYRCVFFTRRDEAVKALADLRGRTLVLQALRSTSAFAVPKAELLRAGLVLVPAEATPAPGGAVRYVLAGAEINQAVWVLEGRGDAGAFNEGDWAALPDRVRAQLRIFHESAPIIRGLLSFRTGLSPDVRAKAEALLLGLHSSSSGRSALAAAAGITRLLRLTAEDQAHLDGWARVLKPHKPE
jgi:phosphonate transport system substrate-binding protein